MQHGRNKYLNHTNELSCFFVSHKLVLTRYDVASSTRLCQCSNCPATYICTVVLAISNFYGGMLFSTGNSHENSPIG